MKNMVFAVVLAGGVAAGFVVGRMCAGGACETNAPGETNAPSAAVASSDDALNKANLETTARAYVDCDMEIAATAKALFQHPNTVRYRLTKIQKLMRMENSAMFLPMLSLTMQLSSILEEDGEH